ncbi:MAG TPA: biotin-dependent carboxyltransferase family protein [Candidatus Saccharimonadales bacterium]|nr:biotin-dependent carboxyltransferase family protein [Candidatus Saccharimonadales bacterium]
MTRIEGHVLEPGLLTTVQDASGRPGLGRFGIPPGGAMDAPAARLANRLVGGQGDEALLELTWLGPTIRWTTAVHLGLAGGDLDATADGIHLHPGHSHRLAAGTVLRFGTARAGARGYLAVEGGLEVPQVLGSAATDRRSGFGGLEGRALAVGDVLHGPGGPLGPVRSAVGLSVGADDRRIPVVATSSSLGWFDPAALTRLVDTAWVVAPDADRSGIRLTGGALAASASGIDSLGVPVGAIQVPPSGEPIVTMTDGPVTGGYPVVGVVAPAAIGRLAQRGPGATVRFELVEAEAARALVASEDAVSIVADPGDVAASWAR